MIAELEGFKPVVVAGMVKTVCSFNYAPIEHSSNKGTHNYNKNKAKLFDLMVKHKAEVRYAIKLVAIDNLADKYEQVSYESESEIPRAIIICILKSKNII